MRISGDFILPVNEFPEVFADSDISEEQRSNQKMVAEFVKKEILPPKIIDQIENKDLELMRRLLSACAKLGLLGGDVPEEYGGAGLDKISSVLVAEEVARQASFACSFLAHTGIGTSPILLFGTEEQKRKYLPKLASGEWIGAYALTESGAGSDANAARTTAERSAAGSGYIITGEKAFTTNGGLASLFTVFAKLDGKLTAFILDPTCINGDCSGVSMGKEEHKMGIKGSSTTPLSLSSVYVPKENLLWGEGKGFKIAMNVLNIGRFKLGAACLGAGRQCLSESVDYARSRKQFGKPIIEFGLIREKLAEMAALIYAMETVVYRTAGLIDGALGSVDTSKPENVAEALQSVAVECALIKVFCSEALDYIVDENVQIHGGLGYCDNPERYYRDARINRIFEGTNEINRLFAVGTVLKKAEAMNLMTVIKGVTGELLTSQQVEESTDLAAGLLARLNNAKKATLLASGAAFKKFGPALETRQYVLGQLSDCLMYSYVMESVLGAFVKGRQTEDESVVRLIFSNELSKIEACAKSVFAVCQEGDDLRMGLAAIRRFFKNMPENKEDLYENILTGLL